MTEGITAKRCQVEEGAAKDRRIPGPPFSNHLPFTALRIQTVAKENQTSPRRSTDRDTDVRAVHFEQTWFCPEESVRMHYKSYRVKVS